MSTTVNEPKAKVEVHAYSKPGNVTLATGSSNTNATIGVVKETTTVISQTLAYAPGAGAADSAALQAHIDDPEPHPAYDIDMPTLKLYFENGLV